MAATPVTIVIGGVTYAAVAPGASRMAIAFDPGFPVYERLRYHLPGTDGNYVVPAGLVGGQVVARVCYQAQPADCYSYLQADVLSWANTAVSVTANGTTITGTYVVQSATADQMIAKSVDAALLYATIVLIRET